MLISEPEMLKVMLSLSLSVAVTVPIAVWFSLAAKDEAEVIVGAWSSRSLIEIVMSWVAELVPSVAVTVAL